MARSIRVGSRITTAVIYAVLLVIGFFTLYPFYYVFIQSFADPKEVLAGSVYLWPKKIFFGSFKLIVSDPRMWQAYGYTILYVVCGTALNVAASVLGAYPLSVKKLFGRKIVVRMLVFTMYFSGGLIPTFLLITKIGLYNNIFAMIIPGVVSVWHIILVRTYMMTIPDEMKQSAVMDGAGHIRMLSSIIVPLCKPVLAVISIYAIVTIWNSWFNALLYLPNSELHPLQFYLYRVMIQQNVDMSQISSTLNLEAALQRMMRSYQLKYSLIIFTTLPVIFTYPFFQKYFVKGVMLGSLKG
ncbi:MAG: carbohydrate ABC transporter permease [Spirochaetales bacterium]|jgi:putative aldouronate transport system permease protein|nr:carbohydrate ABC transporter permease [Spirochaetales bacterium]